MSKTCTCNHSTIAGFHDRDCPKPNHPGMPITVWIDGGCRNNGTPDASGYCSVRIKGQKPEDTLFSIDLPNAKTNNEAEYGALLCALDILRTLEDFPLKSGYNIAIYTDSMLVVQQVAGNWKAKPKFIPPRDIIRKTMSAFKRHGILIQLTWLDNLIIKEKLGH